VTLDEVLGLRVAVWGLGAEGAALVALARRHGVEPLLVDDRPDRDGGVPTGSSVAGAPVLLPADVSWTEVDVVVRAPGVSRYRSELVDAEAAGVTVTTAMALWLEDYAEAPVVAVTGTKGKSTTAALAAEILRADGLEVELIGNIGVPVLDTYGRAGADAYVVEVSSYQAADVATSPEVVVLTSLAPDHLDWHGGVEPYYRDKLRLVTAGRAGGSDGRRTSCALAVSAGNAEAVRRTAGHPDRTLYGPDGRVRVDAAGWVEVDGSRVADAGRLRMPGRHNVWNLCGAVAGALLLRGRAPSPGAVADVVAGFAGLPSRCHVLGVRDGRTYVDDALASNPFAAAASIGTFAGRPLTVVVGGADRGVDPRPMVEALAAHRPQASVVILPPGADRLGEALAAGGLDPGVVHLADDLHGAVARAASLTPDGGVVLFSPGAPTPDGAGGYRDRSRRFAAAAGLGTGGPPPG
jgi:UDP-N-acetylmuramoylalanine--D-glutamate ligase